MIIKTRVLVIYFLEVEYFLTVSQIVLKKRFQYDVCMYGHEPTELKDHVTQIHRQ
jgi:hypothetical protein